MTEYLKPATIAEAAEQRASNPGYTVLAGGTDLLVASKHATPPPGIIDVFGLSELVGIREIDDGDVVIGAATTYRQIIESDIARKALPSLCYAAREIGALQIQARGTLGGNIANSSPVGDTLPVLIALDARIVLCSKAGQREVAYDEFCTGYRQTAMRDDELIMEIRFPRGAIRGRQFWRKIGTRRAQSISKVMVAATARLEGSTIAALRVGVGAVAEVPYRARAAEKAGIGQPVNHSTASAVAAALRGEIHPIDDVRSTARYRASAAANVLARFVASIGDA